MLPLISSFTSASSGPQGSLSSATADMIWPDVQYPHWYPSKALHRVQRVGRAQALDRRDLCPVVHQGQAQARGHPAAVHVHGARPALPVVAALLRSGEDDDLTEAIEKRRPWVNGKPLLLAVDAQRDRDRALDARPRRDRPGRSALGGGMCRRSAPGDGHCRSRSAGGREKCPTGQIRPARVWIVSHRSSPSGGWLFDVTCDGAGTAQAPATLYSSKNVKLLRATSVRPDAIPRGEGRR